MTALSAEEIEAYVAEIEETRRACGARLQGHAWRRVFSVGGGRRSAVYERCDDCGLAPQEPPYAQWTPISEAEEAALLDDDFKKEGGSGDR
jgi:hypothetical protein